ncbi:MAG: mandelate racemase/muconate lactonizing enzyme family protein [Chloroflexota bacterium]|nr:mandelate racemase/muconate lactonizing enzyme family protein [Chloroflexota bacterium]MEC9451560.1 mandelate racemase/muconate lactonizing enzyme family protein [Chloroflexota bacterium]MQG04677.1 mandelate racemase/muconate lactonizing enzyme family protein [SAR202 cluster bacterium]|tara:strand:- start:1285 stop:2487 length:1203 start_codon:yes stop_codon:yes gene_type:complete
MKITNVIPYPIWIGSRNQLLVKIETDSDVFGWGESGLSARELGVSGIIEHYKDIIVGMDPFEIGKVWQRLYRSQYFEGGRTLTAAISAIDLALYDIKGKALGVPVYELIGGKQRDIVPTFATTSAPPGQEMIDQAKKLIKSGWQAFRLSMSSDGGSGEFESIYTKSRQLQNDELIFEPRESLNKTAEWLVKARDELGSEVVLGVDLHHRFSVAEAASFCNKLPSGTLDFVEEPIRDETPSAYEALRKMTNIPFAIGEEFSSKWQFVPYIENDLTQFARVDICNVGGITESLKVAGWCESHYIDMMPHNPLGPVCTAASIHFGASIPNFAWLETRESASENAGFSNDEIIKIDHKMENAMFKVADTPGLGISVNEEILKESKFKKWDPPQLKRTDGSVTNW